MERRYTLARKVKDGFERETIVYFLGFLPVNDRRPEEQLFQPKWGYPHADGIRDMVTYRSMGQIDRVIRQICKYPVHMWEGYYVVDTKIEEV